MTRHVDVDWWFHVLVAGSFTMAGAAGGFAPRRIPMTMGIYFWLVGSCLLYTQAVFAMGLKLGQQVDHCAKAGMRQYHHQQHNDNDNKATSA